MNTKDRHNMMRIAVVLRKITSLSPLNPMDIKRTANAAHAAMVVCYALAGAASSMQYAEGADAIEDGLVQAEELIEEYRKNN